ncbi:MAG: erythromycin esterase family protein, partial [Neobacillus sp.]
MYDSIKKYTKPFNSIEELEPLFQAIGDAKYVLLGESSHGTSEYYTLRAKLTKKLIKEKGFSFIAVEGDWPACQGINRYIKSIENTTKDVKEVL